MCQGELRSQGLLALSCPKEPKAVAWAVVPSRLRAGGLRLSSSRWGRVLGWLPGAPRLTLPRTGLEPGVKPHLCPQPCTMAAPCPPLAEPAPQSWPVHLPHTQL